MSSIILRGVPEQVLRRKVDGRADQYGLAITAYQLLTGAVPFSASTSVEVAFMQVNEPLPLPRSRNPTLSRDVEQVLLRALAKEPDDRYPTCAAFVTALALAAPAEPPPLPMSTPASSDREPAPAPAKPALAGEAAPAAAQAAVRSQPPLSVASLGDAAPPASQAGGSRWRRLLTKALDKWRWPLLVAGALCVVVLGALIALRGAARPTPPPISTVTLTPTPFNALPQTSATLATVTPSLTPTPPPTPAMTAIPTTSSPAVTAPPKTSPPAATAVAAVLGGNQVGSAKSDDGGAWRFSETNEQNLINAGLTFLRVTSGACATPVDQAVVFEAQLQPTQAGDQSWGALLTPIGVPAQALSLASNAGEVTFIPLSGGTLIDAALDGVPPNTTFAVCLRHP